MRKLTIALILILLWAGSANADWMYAISRMQNGQPKDVTFEIVHGWVLIGEFDVYGAYLFSGTASQLIAVNALPSVVGICRATVGDTVLPELNDTITPSVRTKINNYLTSIGKDYQIPAGATNAQVIKRIYKYFRGTFESLNDDWVKDQ